MNFPRFCAMLALAGVVAAGFPLRAQPPAVAPQVRPLAPGVLTVIPTAREAGETFSGPRPLVELTSLPGLDWTPNYEPKSQTLLEQAKTVTLRHPIWCLEFAFKPLRMVYIDIPQPTGKMQRKQIWYMAYRVKNIGFDLKPIPTDQDPAPPEGEAVFGIERVNYPTHRFFPHFVLESHEYKKQYLDRVIPAAKEVIQSREKPGVPMYNSVEISQVPIPLSDGRIDRSVWGYVTWEDIDPRMDYFSIYVRGLTNAFEFVDPASFKPGDQPGTGRLFSFKTLQLNFWRPGDTERQHEGEISYGVRVDADPIKQAEILAKYGLTERLDHLWIFR